MHQLLNCFRNNVAIGGDLISNGAAMESWSSLRGFCVATRKFCRFTLCYVLIDNINVDIISLGQTLRGTIDFMPIAIKKLASRIDDDYHGHIL